MAVGLVGGVVLGPLASATQAPALLATAKALKPVGALFLNLLSMVVIPLVAAAVFTGIARLGNLREVGRLGARTLAYFWGTTIVAIGIGVVCAKLVLPLGSLDPRTQATLRAAATTDSA